MWFDLLVLWFAASSLANSYCLEAALHRLRLTR